MKNQSNSDEEFFPDNYSTDLPKTSFKKHNSETPLKNKTTKKFPWKFSDYFEYFREFILYISEFFEKPPLEWLHRDCLERYRNN